MRNPIDAGFDFVTTTVHKTLRGPRAGLILSKKAHAATIDASVFPGLQGGPHMNNIAGVAIALQKAATPEFERYGRQVLANAKALAQALLNAGVTLITGGTDNHMLVVDTIATFGLDGRRAEEVLDRIGITTNKQIIPDDPNPPLRPSGIRIGSPACTTRGMVEADMTRVANWIVEALRHGTDEPKLDALGSKVKEFCSAFPVPGIAAAIANA
jgi:glycine hydroxymethyltransferase